MSGFHKGCFTISLTSGPTTLALLMSYLDYAVPVFIVRTQHLEHCAFIYFSTSFGHRHVASQIYKRKSILRYKPLIHNTVLKHF